VTSIIRSGLTYLVCTVTLDGHEESTPRTIRLGSVLRQVGTSYDPKLDLRVDDEGEADSVLLASEETLGPIDRIQTPEALRKVSSVCRNAKLRGRGSYNPRPFRPPWLVPRSIAASSSSSVQDLPGPRPHCSCSPIPRGAAKASLAS
jgi:hypothetical protein